MRSHVIFASHAALAAVAAVLLFGMSLPVTPPAEAAEGLKVNYGGGQHGRYQEQMAGFLLRIDKLEEKLNGLYIPNDFCSKQGPAFAQINAELQAVRRDYNAVRAEYRKFRDGLTTLAKSQPQMMSGFDPSEPGPDNPNFWNNGNGMVDALEPLLRARESELLAAKNKNCNGPANAAGAAIGNTAVQSVAPPVPPVAQDNPLAGLTPPLWRPSALPKPPPHFCSQQEKTDYYDKVFYPVYDRLTEMTGAVAKYHWALWDRYQGLDRKRFGLEDSAQRASANATQIAEMKRQMGIVKARIDAHEPTALAARALLEQLNALSAEILRAPVIDCNKRQTGPLDACLVGSWQSEKVEIEGIGNVGGAGIQLTVEPDGKVTLAYSGMKPLQTDPRTYNLWEGSSTGQIRTEYAQLVTVVKPGSGDVSRKFVDTNGKESRNPLAGFGPAGIGSGIPDRSYSCAGTMLTYRNAAHKFTFSRRLTTQSK
jgi:hypothetical protein